VFVAIQSIVPEPTRSLLSMNLAYCCKRPNYDFCISQGSVATVLRWGDQNYSRLRHVSCWCRVPKIIKIGQCFKDLLNNKSGTFHGPRCRLHAAVDIRRLLLGSGQCTMDDQELGGGTYRAMASSQERLKEQGTLQSQGDKSAADEVSIHIALAVHTYAKCSLRPVHFNFS